jgi:hypothetical protein
MPRILLGINWPDLSYFQSPTVKSWNHKKWELNVTTI